MCCAFNKSHLIWNVWLQYHKPPLPSQTNQCINLKTICIRKPLCLACAFMKLEWCNVFLFLMQTSNLHLACHQSEEDPTLSAQDLKTTICSQNMGFESNVNGKLCWHISTKMCDFYSCYFAYVSSDVVRNNKRTLLCRCAHHPFSCLLVTALSRRQCMFILLQARCYVKIDEPNEKQTEEFGVFCIFM